MSYVLMALGVSFLWGLNPVLLKSFLEGGIDVKLLFVLSGFFYSSCMVVFVAWNWTTLRTSLKSVSWSTIGVVAITSALTSFVAMLIFVTLLRDNEAGITTALAYTAPLVTVLLAWGLLGERLTALKLAGVITVVLGVFMVAYK